MRGKAAPGKDGGKRREERGRTEVGERGEGRGEGNGGSEKNGRRKDERLG
jgi:hypothetical protein